MNPGESLLARAETLLVNAIILRPDEFDLAVGQWRRDKARYEHECKLLQKPCSEPQPKEIMTEYEMRETLERLEQQVKAAKSLLHTIRDTGQRYWELTEPDATTSRSETS